MTKEKIHDLDKVRVVRVTANRPDYEGDRIIGSHKVNSSILMAPVDNTGFDEFLIERQAEPWTEVEELMEVEFGELKEIAKQVKKLESDAQ